MRFKMKTLFRVAKDFENYNARLSRAGASAVKRAAVGLKDDLRNQIRSAGMGNRLANTWRHEVWPKGRPSMNAASSVYSNAPHIIRAYDQGLTIRARSRRWIAIPTENVPPGSRNRRLSPANWPDNLGKLRFVALANGKAMLVVDGVRYTKKGRLRGLTIRKATKTMGERVMLQDRVSVPVFFLVPQVSMRKRLDVKRAADKWGAQINALIDQGMSTNRS